MFKRSNSLLGVALAALLTFISTSAWAADPYVQSNTVTVGSAPLDVAYAPNGLKAYVLNNGSDSVSVIDTATNTVTATITVGTGPAGIAVAPNGSIAVVANYASQNVSIIDLSDNTVKQTIAIASSAPKSVVFSPNSDKVYISSQTSTEKVYVINNPSITSTSISSTISLATGTGSPTWMAMDPNGAVLYVAHNSQVISFVNTSDYSSVDVTYAGTTALTGLAVSTSGGELYAADRTASGQVLVINTSTKALSATITGFVSPQALTIRPGSSELYVANRVSSSATMRVVDLNNNTLTSSVLSVGNTPSAIAFNTAGTKAYVANQTANSASILSFYQSRTIAFSTTSYSVPFGSTQAVIAAPSGGAGTGTISYSAGSSTACSVVPATGIVTITSSTGTCSISSSITSGATDVSNTWAAATTSTAVTITPQAVSLGLTAGNISIAPGGTVTPSYSISSGALVSPNTISGVTYTYAGTGSTSYSASTTAPTNVGTYSITPSAAVFSNGSSANYSINYLPGTLTIGTPPTPPTPPTPSELPHTGENVQGIFIAGFSALGYGFVLLIARRYFQKRSS